MDRKPTLKDGEQPLAGYTVRRLLGKGGLGEVYFGTSAAGKEVALKLFTDGRGVQARGARTILNLSHANLVHLYDLVTDRKGREWLVMEYVPGESLGQLLDRRGALSVGEARRYFADLAEAVVFLHEQNVMHRDLKPTNLLLPRGVERLKVVDFDLSRSVEADHAHTKRIGTEQYMAPEMFTETRYDHRVDIYAAGLILVEMLTGRPVFADPVRQFSYQHQVDPPNLTALPSERLRRIAAKALEKDKQLRYATMSEFATEVEAAFAELLDGARAVPVGKPVPVARLAPAAKADPQGQTVPLALPVPTPSNRSAAAGLIGGMLAIPVLLALVTVPVWLVAGGTDWPFLARLLVTTATLAWAAQLAWAGVKSRERGRLDRRLALAIAGLGIGALAYWLDGWPMPRLSGPEPTGPSESYLFGLVQLPMGLFGIELRYLVFFMLAAFGPRWWRATAADRVERFSLVPVIEAAAWGGLLLLLWPWEVVSPWLGLVPVLLTAIVVQLVSPWVPTVAAQVPRKKRL